MDEDETACQLRAVLERMKALEERLRKMLELDGMRGGTGLIRAAALVAAIEGTLQLGLTLS